jgi:hypothetical protein
MACWTKLYFTGFLHKKQVYMNAGTYEILISLHTYRHTYILRHSIFRQCLGSSFSLFNITYTNTSLFVVKKKNKFTLNSNVYNINTRQKYNFHQPSSNLSLYQTVSHKVLKIGDNLKQFKLGLKNYLKAHSFYSTDKYFNVNRQ